MSLSMKRCSYQRTAFTIGQDDHHSDQSPRVIPNVTRSERLSIKLGCETRRRQHQKEPEHQGDVSPVPSCGVLKSPLGEVLQPVESNFVIKREFLMNKVCHTIIGYT